jgi:hypothetical protein
MLDLRRRQFMTLLGEVSLTWGPIFKLSGVLGAPNEAITCVSCCAK